MHHTADLVQACVHLVLQHQTVANLLEYGDRIPAEVLHADVAVRGVDVRDGEFERREGDKDLTCGEGGTRWLRALDCGDIGDKGSGVGIRREVLECQGTSDLMDRVQLVLVNLDVPWAAANWLCNLTMY